MAEDPMARGVPNWRVSGVRARLFQDAYPRLMGASWTVTIAWAFAAYLGTSVLFALLYAVDPAGIDGAEGFTDLLWFSVQTLSTIGYGGMTPDSPLANVLVIVESFIGLAGVAVVVCAATAERRVVEPEWLLSNGSSGKARVSAARRQASARDPFVLRNGVVCGNWHTALASYVPGWRIVRATDLVPAAAR